MDTDGRTKYDGLGVALITPFDNNNAVDFNSLKRLVNRCIDQGADYLLILGTTAEVPTLSLDEQNAIIQCVKETTHKHSRPVPLMLGLGGNNTDAILQRIQQIDFSGIDSILSVCPYYNRPTQDGLFLHYKTIAEASPVPTILYNVPKRTGVNLTPDTLQRLMEIPSIEGIKDAGGFIMQMMENYTRIRPDFAIISGDDSLAVPMIAMGARGVISVVANLYPDYLSKMVKAALNNNFPLARQMHYGIWNLTQTLFKEGNPTGIKAALSLKNHIHNNLRLPLCPGTDTYMQQLQSQLNDFDTTNYQTHTSQPSSTFTQDLTFLKQHDPNLLLLGNDELGKIIVSPKFQAKVFTSTIPHNDQHSFGWINQHAIQNMDYNHPHINATGGENRFWLGPEGGQYSIFFQDGMDFDHWFTPACLDREEWTLTEYTPTLARFQKRTSLQNYSGTNFPNVLLQRTVELLDRNQITSILGTIPSSLQVVAYSTQNTLTNKGTESWTKETGTLCIWILDMLTCNDHTTLIIPYHANNTPKEQIPTSDYFGTIPPERFQIDDHAVYLKADGKHRSKVGLSALHSTGFVGSYNAKNNILTIAHYDIEPNQPYMNQLWPIQEEPYKGDAVNIYNDGLLADGTQMGPFYEIESSSAADFLQPNQSKTHTHEIYHFVGSTDDLNTLSQQLLNVSLNDIKQAFKKAELNK